ncbi:hypothetical protein FACS1894105_04720 [Clostridia bacterium]|nr:hypothetical protein FACS1894105_04720 [Clostridia bacterium]
MFTRKRIISFAIIAVMLLTIIVPAIGATYSDIPTTAQQKRAVEKAIAANILIGYDSLIRPNDDITRAEFAAMINRTFGNTKLADVSKFTDIDTNEWYYNDIRKAVARGLLKGDAGTNKIRPKDKIKNEEALAVLARAFQLGTASTAVVSSVFNDAKTTVADWALPEIAALYDIGAFDQTTIAKGLRGKTYMTRVELAILLDNVVAQFITAPGTYSNTTISGNVIVNVPNVTLNNVKINGNLFVGDGVGSGVLLLKDTTISGTTKKYDSSSTVSVSTTPPAPTTVAATSVTVTRYNSSASISSDSLTAGTSIQLAASVSPTTATDKKITWTTSDATIANIYPSADNSTVVVYGINNTNQARSATITAYSTATPTVYKTITITVNPVPQTTIVTVSDRYIYLSAPVAGNIAPSSISASSQFSGSVYWSPTPVNGRFSTGTSYTASITLAPSSLYTLSGVPANFFSVAGAYSTVNSASSNYVTAIFPATAGTITDPGTGGGGTTPPGPGDTTPNPGNSGTLNATTLSGTGIKILSVSDTNDTNAKIELTGGNIFKTDFPVTFDYLSQFKDVKNSVSFNISYGIVTSVNIINDTTLTSLIIAQSEKIPTYPPKTETISNTPRKLYIAPGKTLTVGTITFNAESSLTGSGKLVVNATLTNNTGGSEKNIWGTSDVSIEYVGTSANSTGFGLNVGTGTGKNIAITSGTVTNTKNEITINGVAQLTSASPIDVNYKVTILDSKSLTVTGTGTVTFKDAVSTGAGSTFIVGSAANFDSTLVTGSNSTVEINATTTFKGAVTTGTRSEMKNTQSVRYENALTIGSNGVYSANNHITLASSGTIKGTDAASKFIHIENRQITNYAPATALNGLSDILAAADTTYFWIASKWTEPGIEPVSGVISAYNLNTNIVTITIGTKSIKLDAESSVIMKNFIGYANNNIEVTVDKFGHVTQLKIKGNTTVNLTQPISFVNTKYAATLPSPVGDKTTARSTFTIEANAKIITNGNLVTIGNGSNLVINAGGTLEVTGANGLTLSSGSQLTLNGTLKVADTATLNVIAQTSSDKFALGTNATLDLSEITAIAQFATGDTTGGGSLVNLLYRPNTASTVRATGASGANILIPYTLLATLYNDTDRLAQFNTNAVNGTKYPTIAFVWKTDTLGAYHNPSWDLYGVNASKVRSATTLLTDTPTP